jgi:protein gp37
MGANTKIQWCDHTFNPWIGCTKVSPGCLNCYAEAMNTRWRAGVNWGKGAPRARTSVSNWNEPLKWDRAAAADTIEWNRVAQGSEDLIQEPAKPRVFCASLADWLDDEAPIAWLSDLVSIIRQTPNLDWLLLTKRPELFFNRLTEAGRYSNSCDQLDSFACRDGLTADFIEGWIQGQPPANVWIGTSIEDQTRADFRIPHLLRIPARIRFLSCEPLLGPVDIGKACGGHWFTTDGSSKRLLHWIIAGGESGPGAREMKVDWARSLATECKAVKVPFFMKQLGGVSNHKGQLEDFPADLQVREFPK